MGFLKGLIQIQVVFIAFVVLRLILAMLFGFVIVRHRKNHIFLSCLTLPS